MIDLVLCRMQNGRGYLFRAPYCVDLDPLDEVIVDTVHGEQHARVEKILHVFGDEVLNFIVACTGATLPLKKVLRKVCYREIEYKEETK